MKQKPLLTALLLASAAFAMSACNNGAKTTVFDAAATKTVIEARGQEFADSLKKGDSVALANFYTTDAKVMGSGAPSVTGKDNIAKEFGGFIKAGITDVKFTTLGVWGTDSLVVEDGLAVFKFKNGAVAGQDKYLVVWKKQEGKWMIFRDMFNSDLPEKGK